MKVLVSAIACNPYGSSESFVGWEAVCAIATHSEVHVLTSSRYEKDIIDAAEKGLVPENLTFHYCGRHERWNPDRLMAKFQSWLEYRTWFQAARAEAARLHGSEKFDLAHHVTYATWRMGSPLAGLGIPWIWGPIGGGDAFPHRLMGILSPSALFFELTRNINSWISSKSRKIRNAVLDAAMILPNNPETELLMRRLGCPGEKIRRVTQSFLSEEKIDDLGSSCKKTPAESGLMVLVAGGNLEGRKGVAIALEALVLFKKRGIPFRYDYLGGGPERDHLIDLAVKLGLADEVTFHESLSGSLYLNALKNAHVYLLPSLREGVPVTQMEAMAAGCVPIVANCGGGGPMASEGGMHPIKPQALNAMAQTIDDELARLWKDPAGWSELSRKSSSAITTTYSRASYLKKIVGVYDETKIKIGMEKQR